VGYALRRIGAVVRPAPLHTATHSQQPFSLAALAGSAALAFALNSHIRLQSLVQSDDTPASTGTCATALPIGASPCAAGPQVPRYGPCGRHLPLPPPAALSAPLQPLEGGYGGPLSARSYGNPSHHATQKRPKACEALVHPLLREAGAIGARRATCCREAVSGDGVQWWV